MVTMKMCIVPPFLCAGCNWVGEGEEVREASKRPHNARTKPREMVWTGHEMHVSVRLAVSPAFSPSRSFSPFLCLPRLPTGPALSAQKRRCVSRCLTCIPPALPPSLSPFSSSTPKHAKRGGVLSPLPPSPSPPLSASLVHPGPGMERKRQQCRAISPSFALSPSSSPVTWGTGLSNILGGLI